MTAFRTALAVAIACMLALAAAAQADTVGPIDFESYSVGNIDGQNGWSKTGPYDAAVANVGDFANAAGFGFGSHALRSSNAVTSGSFGDQTFSPGLAQPAGESAGRFFDARFSIGTTQASEQPDLHMSVSPDSGDGSRMSYLRFEDQADGVHVFFVDTSDPGPLGTVANFNESDVATLDRSSAHTIRFSIFFVPGAGNDVVKIYVDGNLVATGTTWEDYYRYDPEQAGNGNVVPTVSKLLFRESGGADSGLAGQGFLIDGVGLSSVPQCSSGSFSDSGTTRTLTEDCTTDHTITVPNGFTLDGNGHTITALDPSGGHFVGPVVTNAGTAASVRNLRVTSFNLADVCDGGADRLRGILLDGASGSIANNTVTGVRQGHSGCQEGNAIEARNLTASGTPALPQRTVSITGNVISDYQKNAITTNGGLAATITGNTTTGDGPVTYIAQNGIQVAFGASATVKGNTVSGNSYAPSSAVACGLLFFDASGVKASSNTLFANEKDQCNSGKGGGNVKPAS